MECAASEPIEPPIRLIVNADDFGQTHGINRAILELHEAGLLTSATLMARAAATDQAIEIVRRTPSLNVGCHVVLTDGWPVLPPSQIPSLVDPSTGNFYSSFAGFLERLFTGRINSEEIEAEAKAQIHCLQSCGMSVTHIDSHKHTHMFPRVLRPLLRGARACGIRRVRNPFEPTWAILATARCNLIRAGQVAILRSFQPSWQRIVTEEGFCATGGTLGVTCTGALKGASLERLLGQLPPGTWELVTHPGYNDAELASIQTTLRESRDIERKVLSVLREFPALQLISWNELTQ
jgi:predicted glycoside hydrolase/deacetylase ChbG (UPF0249 family)